MMVLTAGTVGGMGLACILFRRSLLGIVIGGQLLILGATLMFVLAGVSSGARVQGHLFGLFITLNGVAQLASGCAIAVRLFYLKNRIKMEELRSLKR